MITSITSADFSGRSKSLTSLGILLIIRIEFKYHSFAAFESAMLTTPEKLLKIMSTSEFQRNILPRIAKSFSEQRNNRDDYILTRVIMKKRMR